MNYGVNVQSVIRPKRGRPLVDDKRRTILDAALRVFADKGFHGAAIPDIAKAAAVGTGTLYRYFADKEALVNEVFRDAKGRLALALDVPAMTDGRTWFVTLWERLAAFAQAEPEAFRFLEMQDHVPYLDATSKRLELSVLAPIFVAGTRLRKREAGPPVDVAIALLWGAFVGLVKASRLGYLTLDAKRLASARDACWRLITTTTKGS